MPVQAGLLLTALLWGATLIAARILVPDTGIYGLGFWRFLIAAAVLLPPLLIHRRLHIRSLLRDGVPLALMGVIGVFGFSWCLFTGLPMTSPVNAALIMTLNPALAALFGGMMGAGLPGRRLVAGLVLGMAGVALVSVPDPAHLAALRFNPGDGLILAGNAGWALYGVLARLRLKVTPPDIATAVTMSLGALCFAIAALVAGHGAEILPPAPGLWPLIGFLAIGGTVLTYVWWTRGVMALGAARAALAYNLVPVAAMGFTWALYGTAPLPAQIIGAILAGAGLMIATGLFSRVRASA